MSPKQAIALVAVMAALLVGVAAFVLGPERSSRPGPPSPAQPAAFVTLRAPRGEVAAIPQEFSWAPVRGASSYRVRISDEDAVWPLLLKTTTASSLLLDPKEAAAITPGRIHVWEVEALDERGVPVATGGTRFRVTPVGAESESEPNAGGR